MTADQSFKIVGLLEAALPRDKAQEVTREIEAVLSGKAESATKELATRKHLAEWQLSNAERLDKGLQRLGTRLWGIFFALLLLISGLYFKK